MISMVRFVALAVLAMLSHVAVAHEMSMAEMQVREISPGEFAWQWTASGSRPAGEELTPVWPETCREQDNMLRCGPEGLRGTLSVNGVGKRYSAAMVTVFWLDNQSRVYTLTKSQSTVRLYGSAEDRRGMGEIASAYVVLGVEHILSGYDHLLFVISLLFLVRFNKQLLYTITAFTVAHSVTLVLSALGLLTLRSAPVEATIALSIMLVAGEALHKQPTLSRRWPALVAFLFGLVHGLGFAGALADIGLPQNHLAVALLTFNLGVEVGQLLVVAMAYAAYLAIRHWTRAELVRVPALYAIGSVAAYWSLSRIAGILS
jgi:hypothetical protein